MHDVCSPSWTCYEEAVEPAHTVSLTVCRTSSVEPVCSSWPPLVSTPEINYDLLWHNRNPLCGARQIVARGMFRHESRTAIAGVSDTLAPLTSHCYFHRKCAQGITHCRIHTAVFCRHLLSKQWRTATTDYFHSLLICWLVVLSIKCHKMVKNCGSVFPKAQDDILKCLVLSTTQR